MAKCKVCFVTVCGGGEDYEYLLGSVEHHSGLGCHIVLDTSENGFGRYFKKIPPSVNWVWDPRYGFGWKSFRFVDALNEAIRLAEFTDPSVIVQLDSDDFFTRDLELVLPTAAAGAVVELQYVHWLRDGKPYLYGESEWHRRVWPGGRGIRFRESRIVPSRPELGLNRQIHPELDFPDYMDVVRSGVLCRNHVHYGVGGKIDDTIVAEESITGWPHGRMEISPKPWPSRLAAWRDNGVRPSESFR